ncbi:carbohydrate kinase [Streptococcus pneumoniae]|nr:carbohydrate kinase [Streptococcus pneumoniae]VME12845.1 carbohydrate kinase [Streptococcus pneumoniae]VRG31271.1 carbohydrate kinase [Streptococcus pneumoniae]
MKVINQTLLEKVIIERSRSSHKGDYGRLLLLGGTYPYGGAIIMAALAAVKSGAGLVTVGTDREISRLCTAIYLSLWPFLFKTSNC